MANLVTLDQMVGAA